LHVDGSCIEDMESKKYNYYFLRNEKTNKVDVFTLASNKV